MPQDDDSDSILPRICGDSLPKCQVVEIPTSTSLSPGPTHGHINSGATVADDKVEFKFTMDEGSESRLSNASSLSVYAGYASGHSKAEALDVVNVGDLEKHDYDWTMVTTIAVIRSWHAHAILLMIFSGLLSALVATQLLSSRWTALSPLPWLGCIGRVFQFMMNPAASGAPLPPPPPPPSRLASYYDTGHPAAILLLSPLPPVTQALWLTSLAVSLGCAVVASLLKQKACRALRRVSMAPQSLCPRVQGDKGEYAYSGEVGRPLVDMTKFFYAIHAGHLLSVGLYLWGLSVPLLRDSEPHQGFFLVVVGSGAAFFLGQYLIVSAFSRVTVHYPRRG